MPLTKRAPTAAAQPATPASEADPQKPVAQTALDPASAGGTQPVPQEAKRLGGTRKPSEKAEAPMTKDDYWRRREERDIETGVRIRRSGVWQASLQSLGIIQLNTANTLESFLALVEKAADAGLNYVNKD